MLSFPLNAELKIYCSIAELHHLKYTVYSLSAKQADSVKHVSHDFHLEK